MRRSLVLLFALAIAACGSESAPSSTGDGEKYVDSILTSYRNSQGKAFSTKEARCLAEAAIDAVGVPALREAEIEPGDLEVGNPFQTMGAQLPKPVVDDVSKALVDARCVSISTILLRSGVAEGEAFSRIPKAKVRCIFDRLGAPARAQRAFADSLLGLPRGQTEFNASFRSEAVVRRALAACKVDSSLIG